MAQADPDILIRPIRSLDDAETCIGRFRERLIEGDMDGARRALVLGAHHAATARAIIAARRARL